MQRTLKLTFHVTDRCLREPVQLFTSPAYLPRLQSGDGPKGLETWHKGA